MSKNKEYVYYKLNENGTTGDEFISYIDIATEYGIGKGSIAGKFYRAVRKNQSQILVNGDIIKRVEVAHV